MATGQKPFVRERQYENGTKCGKINAGIGDVSKEALVSTQRNGKSLSSCFAATIASGQSATIPRFLLQDGLLTRWWSSD